MDFDTIKNYYPFLKKTGYKRDDRNSRKEYELRASGIQIKPLIQDLLKYSILKYEQLIEANKFFELINTRNRNEEKEQIYLKLKELKNSNNNKPYERLSLFYITGLFDAEGSIGIYNKTLRVKITQKSDIVILQKIGEMYGNVNNIDNYAISFYGKNCLKFLNDVKEYCIYKTPQILVALKYIDTINVELTDEVISLREEYIKVLKDEKHV